MNDSNEAVISHGRNSFGLDIINLKKNKKKKKNMFAAVLNTFSLGVTTVKVSVAECRNIKG